MKYPIFWLDGKTEIVAGKDIADACRRAGIQAGALAAMDYHGEGIPEFEVTTSFHDQHCIQILNPSPEERWFLGRVVMSSHMDDPAYRIKRTASPFLQCDEENYILIEFWGQHIGAFIAWLYLNFEPMVAEAKECGLFEIDMAELEVA